MLEYTSNFLIEFGIDSTMAKTLPPAFPGINNLIASWLIFRSEVSYKSHSKIY